MLVIFASVAVLGVTTFIVQRLGQNEVTRMQAKTIYLAQAGINNAVYFFRFHDRSANGYFTLGQANIDTQNFFVLEATAADLLMVNTSNSSVGGSKNRGLLGLRLQNATNSKTITIDRMVVTWDNPQKLNQIRIGGITVFKDNKGLASPANADINDFALSTKPNIYNVNYLRFSGSMVGAKISIQFMMTDGSSRNLAVLPKSDNYNFTAKSTGKTTFSNFYRTIQADYNALTSRVINYNEINTEITP